MNDPQHRFRLLLQRYFEKTASTEEREELFQMLRDAKYDGELSSFIETMWEGYELPEGENIDDGREVLIGILGNKPAPRVHFLKTGWFRYAAAAILLLGAAVYLWTAGPEKAPVADAGKPAETDIAAGKNGAVLTLADGTQVTLDSLADGVVATQSGAQLVLSKGSLAYEAAGKSAKETVYNTMSTPNGRQFRLVLLDGSKVWLNAASSIRYPAAFTGNARNVEIDGEVFFEIAKNAEKPFRVKIDEANEVEVLGTSFNISAYKNENAIKTTLVEGAVKVSANRQSKILKPGQQAVSAGSTPLTVVNGDVEKAVAWKNGLFNFEGMRLKEVMNQLERWYDIEVIYEGPVKDMEFFGKIDRNASLNSIIRVLKAYGVNCRREGRRLIMLP